jgi:uncharacterized protein (TIGR02611 family)
MTSEPAPEDRSAWAARLDAWRDRYEAKGRLYKAGWLLVGTLITIAGIIMIVTPGPALVLIPLGLAMLAMQFEWAETLMEKALAHAERTAEQAKETTPLQRVLAGLAVVVLIGLVVGGVFYFDINVPVLNPA